MKVIKKFKGLHSFLCERVVRILAVCVKKDIYYFFFFLFVVVVCLLPQSVPESIYLLCFLVICILSFCGWMVSINKLLVVGRISWILQFRFPVDFQPRVTNLDGSTSIES